MLKKTLLFLDEIQAAPELLAKLRWFAEKKPELAIIATGSLLDFVLDDHTFNMPVGRINYLYLEPMSFEEFLLAQHQHKLCEFLSSYELKDIIPEAIHQRLWQFLREYVFVGDMPAVVSSWVEKNPLQRFMRFIKIFWRPIEMIFRNMRNVSQLNRWVMFLERCRDY